MTSVPFHQTRMGQRFYEHTMPELVRQLTRLNENLESVIASQDESQPDASEPGDHEAAPDSEGPREQERRR